MRVAVVLVLVGLASGAPVSSLGDSAPVAPQKAKPNNVVKFSVVVPCIPRDLPFLPRMLASINLQTFPPDEVILALSGAPQDNATAIQQDYQKLLNVPLVVTVDPQIRQPGINRNRGVALAKGNYVSLMDADDEMQKDRLSVLNSIIAASHAKCILHGAYPGGAEHVQHMNIECDPNKITFGKAIYEHTAESDQARWHDDQPVVHPVIEFPLNIQSNFIIAYGHATCDTQTMRKVPFTDSKRGEDVMFMRKVLEMYGPHDETFAFIDEPLSAYHPSDVPHNQELRKIHDDNLVADSHAKN